MIAAAVPDRADTDFCFRSKLHDRLFLLPAWAESSRVLVKERSITARNTLTNVREHIAQQAPCRREDHARVDVGKTRRANVLEKAELVVG